jgi:hypothetical protein
MKYVCRVYYLRTRWLFQFRASKEGRNRSRVTNYNCSLRSNSSKYPLSLQEQYTFWIFPFVNSGKSSKGLAKWVPAHFSPGSLFVALGKGSSQRSAWLFGFLLVQAYLSLERRKNAGTAPQSSSSSTSSVWSIGFGSRRGMSL